MNVFIVTTQDMESGEYRVMGVFTKEETAMAKVKGWAEGDFKDAHVGLESWLVEEG